MFVSKLKNYICKNKAATSIIHKRKITGSDFGIRLKLSELNATIINNKAPAETRALLFLKKK
jgi:hypothetical protein